MEERIGVVEKSVEENKTEVKALEKKVVSISEELKKREEKVESTVKNETRSVYEEMREREARRLNVVFHRVDEMEGDRMTGAERQDWDKKSCGNIFHALKLKITEDSIKFCRRVGEKGEDARPLIVGFYTETERSELLRNSRYLEDTDFSHVTVGPDLTKKQRQEEAEMHEEAERKNKELSEDDKAKNLQWAVVGGRGERRLIKTVQREWMKKGRRMSRGGAGGEREGRTRQEQRTGMGLNQKTGTRQEQNMGAIGTSRSQRPAAGGFLGSRGEKEKNSRRRSGTPEREKTVGVESGEESEMETGEGARGGGRRRDQARSAKRKERSPLESSPPGKR
jgi:hypothetical protein